MYTIVVANQKGGVGKTTLTMQVAASLSRRHEVLVVDVDPQRSTQWWVENARDTLPFVYAGPQNPGVLPKLDRLGAGYDFVFVDTPGSIDDARILESALNAADYVLVPLTPEPLAIEPTVRTIQRFIEPRRLPYGVVLNKIDPRVPHQHDRWKMILDSTWGHPRLEQPVRRYRVHADAPLLGQLVTGMADNRRTAGAISDITRLGYEVAAQVAETTDPAGAW